MESKKSILVVEDEESHFEVIKVMLESHGYDVFIVRSAQEGIAALESDKHFDLMWLDHYLSGEGSGLDVITAARKSEKYKDIPVFLVSNSAGNENIIKYREQNITKVFPKFGNKLADIVKALKDYLD